jgi:hypothetical protein
MGYYLAIPGGPAAWGRFRHPAMPIMCVVAGYGLSVAWDWLRSADSRFAYARISQVSPSFSTAMSFDECANQDETSRILNR